MKLDAVGVVSTNLPRTITFYKLLGFLFGEITPDEKHAESVSKSDSIRMMIDTQDVIEKIIGELPKPGNHSCFAVHYSSPQEVDATIKNVRDAGFTVVKEPWDAFWGQRYAVVEDPDGYKVDLYAQLESK